MGCYDEGMALCREELSISCFYDLDAALRVVAVSDSWDEFARGNAAPELVGERVLRRPLTSFISDLTTAHLYEQLFDRVRRTGRSLAVPIRCDTPALRQHVELHIQPTAGSGFRVYSFLLRTEARAPQPLLDATRAASPDRIDLCSWCKRALANGVWREVEDAVSVLRLFEAERLPMISHGICPPCRDGVEALIRS